MRYLLVYVLHSSNLYGTERVALATATGLADEFDTIFIGPPGPAMELAEKLGFETRRYRTSIDLARVIQPILAQHKSLTFVATGPRYNIICKALNLLYWRRINQIQMVHAGAGEQKDFARKKFLNHMGVQFVTVSEYVRERLTAHGVRADRIEVVPNFLTAETITALPKRGPFVSKIRNIVVISRLAALKRLDLLLDAMQCRPELRALPVKIVGNGEEFEYLRQRAKSESPNVEFLGFQEEIGPILARADLLVHTCPTEAFGMVVLEAMAAHVPVLVPDAAGTGSLVEDGINGFKFRADDAAHLAQRLIELQVTEPAQLNRVVSRGYDTVTRRYAAATSLTRYRELFQPDRRAGTLFSPRTAIY